MVEQRLEQKVLLPTKYLEECVNKILSECKAYKLVYARQECYPCDGYNKDCPDYLAVKSLPT